MHGMELIDAIRQERSDPPSGIRTLGLDVTHRWLTQLERGRARFTWTVDPAYLNLEGAVICSWTTALADQALFFASNTLCEGGEGTRMADLHLTVFTDMTDGVIDIDASITERVGDRMFGTCTFTREDGTVAARVTAMIDVISS
jgi:acyl-coenzyme A thioesterase PaaI-like protein